MPNSFLSLLRLTSLLVWAMLLAPILYGAWQRVDGLSWSKAEWLIPLWLTFGAALVVSTSARRLPTSARIGAFALQTIAALAMSGVEPEFYVGFLLVIIAWQLAIYLPVRVAAAWVFIQALALFFILSPICANLCGWIASSVYLAFQLFFVATVLMVRREWLARVEQAKLNAELTAAQTLLIERSQAHERLRLSQELHDVMGHSLTALTLNLEVALNTRDASERERSLVTARTLTCDLIGDVRDVVAALRPAEEIDIGQALRLLAGSGNEPNVHLSISPGLALQDPERAHAVLRCVQEVITNARKHARAKNIWISLHDEEGILIVDAHDDGQGAVGGREQGLGIAGMRGRFARLGGEIVIGQQGAGGFALVARLPLAAT